MQITQEEYIFKLRDSQFGIYSPQEEESQEEEIEEKESNFCHSQAEETQEEALPYIV